MPAALALDATLLDEPTTGIGLYTQELHRALRRRGLAVEAWGARRSGEQPRGALPRTRWALAELPALLRAHQPGAFHALSNFNLPLVRVPGVAYVLTVHDLVPLLLPETVSVAFRLQFLVWLSRSLVVADQVVCVSEVTRQSLCERFQVAPEKVSVVHHGLDHVERLCVADETTRKWIDALGLPERWVLYAGALDARKNVELVLEACARLRQGGQPVTLVLAGQRWFGAGRIERRIAELKAAGLDVRVLGYLEPVVFYALMQRAGAFVFPSRYEGFGFPPLEAMRLGVPAVVSTAGSLTEVCQDGALTVDPDDADGLARHLSRLLRDEAYRSERAQAGRRVAERYTWDAAAAATARVYDRLR